MAHLVDCAVDVPRVGGRHGLQRELVLAAHLDVANLQQPDAHQPVAVTEAANLILKFVRRRAQASSTKPKSVVPALTLQ